MIERDENWRGFDDEIFLSEERPFDYWIVKKYIENLGEIREIFLKFNCLDDETQLLFEAILIKAERKLKEEALRQG